VTDRDTSRHIDAATDQDKSRRFYAMQYPDVKLHFVAAPGDEKGHEVFSAPDERRMTALADIFRQYGLSDVRINS